MKRWENELIFTKLIFVTTVILSVLAGQASAATITVKQLGGGNYTTISAAISNAQQDDTIMVYPGRYEEAVVIDKNLQLIGAGPQLTTIYSPANGVEVQQGIKLTILGFTITSAKVGIILKPNSTGFIRNNIVSGNVGYGIQLNCNGATATIVNNVISYNSSDGIYSTGNWNCGGNVVSIYSNIVSNNGGYGLVMPYTTAYISYNNVYSNVSGNYINCSAGAGDISLNPAFINYATGNYALQSVSPCMNTGRPGSADSDPDGTRNDMGAYGGPDAASFWPYPPGAPIITSLTATPTSIPQGSPITINATGEIQ